MTYGELYRQTTTWNARHVANDLRLMFGAETEASETDIAEVKDWQERESAYADYRDRE